MKEFFQNLRERRKQKGISLEEIHNKTYLPLSYLKYIESGNLENLPPAYERLYLRRYAVEIGLDGDEVLRDYDMLSGKLNPSQAKAKMVEKEEKAQKAEKNKSSVPEISNTPKRPPIKSSSMFEQLNLDKINKYFWITLAAMIILITGSLTYRQYIHEKSNQVTIKEITSPGISNERVSLSSFNPIVDTTKTNAVEKNETEQNEPFIVELKAIDTTWVRQILDKDTTEYTLPPGLRKKVEARDQIKFMVGKADGVEFWLNGKNLGIMGSANEVVISLIISEEGIIEKRLKKVVKKSAPENDTTFAVTPIL